MGNSFGKLFTITTWGESHGAGIGVVVDGCPPLLPLAAGEIQAELDRRRPGQSDITTPRNEADRVEILSGVFEGKTTGAPIAMLVRNADQRPGAYDEMREKFRPSHADFAWQAKYGIRDHRGGGRSSARETIGRVAAGAIARKILASKNVGIEIRACVTRIHDVEMPRELIMDGSRLLPFPAQAEIEANVVRCPHAPTAAAMIERIKQARAAGDSVGGVIQCRVRGVPAGLGEPVFNRLDADLAKAMLSIPATKGFEIGSGFAGALLKGSEHNDAWIPGENNNTAPANVARTAKSASETHASMKADLAVCATPAAARTETNRSGGIQGGISNGGEIFFNVAFKPTATIAQPQRTIDLRGAPVEIIGHGRHDPCVLPRAVPIVEAMTALVLVDHWMRQTAQRGTFEF